MSSETEQSYGNFRTRRKSLKRGAETAFLAARHAAGLVVYSIASRDGSSTGSIDTSIDTVDTIWLIANGPTNGQLRSGGPNRTALFGFDEALPWATTWGTAMVTFPGLPCLNVR